MFEKLYELVKNNAGKAVIDNPVVAEKDRDAVINEASSTIIEVLKTQMESGKLSDLVKYFQFKGTYNSPMVSVAVKRFSNKLNKYYKIEPKEASAIANELIPPVMQELKKLSKSEHNKEFALSSLLSKINGNIQDMSLLISQVQVA